MYCQWDNSSKEEKFVITLLTPTGGPLGPIIGLLGMIMNAIYNFFNIFGIQNVALSIFIFTFLMRAAMLPLTIKQQKFTKLSSKMNPELQKIQAKYKGKKDEVSIRKMQAENQAVYEKFGANPTSGCLPILIQLPIMFSLYYVISNIPAYVGKVKDLYQPIADELATKSEFASIVKEIATTDKLAVSKNVEDANHIINILAKFGDKQWEQLTTKIPQITDTVNQYTDQIIHTNNFFGLNIANPPGFVFPALLIPIIAAGLQFIQGKQMQTKTADNKDNPAASAMNSMNVVMPIMSLFFCFSFPIGIGLYWIAGSIFAIVQQYFVNKYMDKIDVDELIQKNVSKAAKKNKNRHDIKGTSLQEIAKRQTKSIETSMTKHDDTGNEKEEVESNNTSSNSPKSISEIANLLKNKN